MKRTSRATESEARVRRLSVAQLERVTAGLAQPQLDAQVVDYPDPQGRVVTVR
jgi:hypothetical protein